MKNMLIKNIHWLIILYSISGLHTMYEETELELENSRGRIPAIQSKITRSKNKIKRINKFKKNLTASKERVEVVVEQIEKVQKQLPADVNDAKVQELVGNIAKDLKIVEPSPTPGAEVMNGFYFTKEYNYSGKGTFLQHLIFFEKLNSAERILNVKNLKLTLSKDFKRSRFKILELSTTIESYRYNKNYKERSGVKEIEQKFQ